MDRQLGFDELAGMPVVIMDDLRKEYPEKFNESGSMDWKWFEKDIRPNYFIYIRRDKNSLSFSIKDKPSSQGGKGAEAIHLIEAAKHMIEYLNSKFSCKENELAIGHLEGAISAINARTADRKNRRVEGYDKA